MERKISDELLKWKRDSQNRPLVLYGPRQVGKTYSVLDFGHKFYHTVAYFNVDNNLELVELLKNEKTLSKLVMKLGILLGETIFKNETLIVFDNCNDINIINELKIFNSDKRENDVIIITSQRDSLSKLKGENFYFRQLMAMDFEEYLLNSDKKQLIDFIKDSYVTDKPMPFHQLALDMYYDYLLCGGFPEVVFAKLNDEEDLKIEAIKQKVISIYKSEFNNIVDSFDIAHCQEIMNSLPYQLLKDNKKFQYSFIKKGGRSKEYENSINYLVSHAILNRSYRISEIKSPLTSVRDIESFKLYFNDSGILFTMMHLNHMKLMTNDELRLILIENNVMNNLVNMGYAPYYYQSDGKAEVSFVIQNRLGKIIPIEIVDTRIIKAKALSLLLAKFSINSAIRVTENNFQSKKGIKYIPCYAAFCLKDM